MEKPPILKMIKKEIYVLSILYLFKGDFNEEIKNCNHCCFIINVTSALL